MNEDDTADAPFKTPGPARRLNTDDRLGRGPFVKNLADAIRRYQGGQSLTIGLHGPWGSGKSSVLRFLVEELHSNSDSDVVVGQFNPWNFSDSNRLISSFFRFFAGLLRHRDNAKALKRVAATVSGLAEVIEPVGNIVDLLALPFAIPPVATGGTAAAKKFAKFLSERADDLSDIEHMKDVVSTALRGQKKRFVIIMDDLDRLPQNEIRQVFQLVKAGADFDNVVYVLAFERGYVAKALDDFAAGHGERYLEKVVNIPFNLPQMMPRQIRRLLYEELEAYSTRQRPYTWDNKRLRDILETLTPYFTTIRLIDMLSNLLIMTEGMLKNDVDFTDHVALTMLQVLEPKVHQYVTNHPSAFVETINTRLLRSKPDDKSEAKPLESDLRERLQVVTFDDAIDVLGNVFPKVKFLFGRGSSDFGLREWALEQRACYDHEMFSRYFRFEVEEADLSSRDVVALIEATRSPANLKTFIETANVEPDRVHRVLERLGDLRHDQIGTDRIRNICSVLFEVADQLPKHVGLSAIFFDSARESAITMKRLLETMQSRDERASLIEGIFETHPTSMALVALFTEYFTKESRDHNPTLFDDEASAKIRGLAGTVIEERYRNATLFESDRAVSYLYSWFRFLPERARDVIRETTRDDDALFLRVVGLFANLHLSGSFDATPLDVKTLSSVFTFDEIDERLTRIAKTAHEASVTEAHRLCELLYAMRPAAPEKDADNRMSDDDGMSDDVDVFEQ